MIVWKLSPISRVLFLFSFFYNQRRIDHMTRSESAREPALREPHLPRFSLFLGKPDFCHKLKRKHNFFS